MERKNQTKINQLESKRRSFINHKGASLNIQFTNLKKKQTFQEWTTLKGGNGIQIQKQLTKKSN